MRFFDKYFFKPSFLHILLSILLLPISLIYLFVSIIRRKCQRFHDFEIPIISVGNLIAGGSGKTPFIKEIAACYENVAIISRGYKRKSKGLLVVSINGELKASQIESGDEAYLLALSLKNATVIVCKNRKKAILKAKELGAKCIFLDDGFRFNFKKLNILLVPKLEPYFPFTLPSGLYRENPFCIKNADLVLKEGREYKRHVYIKNPTQRMLLLTAIASPFRLNEFLRENIVGKIILKDHSNFDFESIREKFSSLEATSLLVTQKDEVKLLNIDLPLSILKLNLEIDVKVKEEIRNYILSN